MISWACWSETLSAPSIICRTLVSIMDSFSALRSMSVTSSEFFGFIENIRPSFDRNDLSGVLVDDSSFIFYSHAPGALYGFVGGGKIQLQQDIRLQGFHLTASLSSI